MPAPFQVVIAGHLCLDIIPTFSAEAGRDDPLPAPGQLRQVGPALVATGGPVSNVGLALHRLGIGTRLVGKVGDDALGRVVLELIRAHDPELAAGIVVAPGQATSYSIVLNLPDRDRSFLHCPGANDTFCAADLKMDEIAPGRLFHFGYPPIMARMYQGGGSELAAVLHAAKELNLTTSLDMAMVDPDSPAGQADWQAILRTALPSVDLFLPSIEETLLLLWRSEFDRLAGRGPLLAQITLPLLHELSTTLLGWGAKMVGFKMGRRGMYLRTAGAGRLAELGKAAPANLQSWGDREIWSPVFQVTQVHGTTGAGDATIAGFLAALLRGCSPEETLTFACAVGACSVQAADALSGIRTWEETWQRIRAGWTRAAL